MHTANTGATRNLIFTWEYLELLILKGYTSFSVNMSYIPPPPLALKGVLTIFNTRGPKINNNEYHSSAGVHHDYAI
jgi:hypothetical protein